MQQCIKKIIQRDQVKFVSGVQGGFHTCKSINMIHHIHKTKDKHHISVLTDAEEAFDKIQHPFLIKISQQSGIEGTHLNVIKGHT